MVFFVRKKRFFNLPFCWIHALIQATSCCGDRNSHTRRDPCRTWITCLYYWRSSWKLCCLKFEKGINNNVVLAFCSFLLRIWWNSQTILECGILRSLQQNLYFWEIMLIVAHIHWNLLLSFLHLKCCIQLKYLFFCLISHKIKVTLLRGNHETRQLNSDIETFVVVFPFSSLFSPSLFIF